MIEFRMLLIREYGSIKNAGAVMEINPIALPLLIHKHKKPNRREQPKLIRHLGYRNFRKYLGRPRYIPQAEIEKLEAAVA